MKKINFIDNKGTFEIKNPENYSGLYLPIAGENGIKSCITPNLGGDSKLDQNHFLLEPVSIENLHNNKNTRNFILRFESGDTWSACGSTALQEAEKFTDKQDESVLRAGFMWQELMRKSKAYGISSRISNFVSIEGSTEMMIAEITNDADQEVCFTTFAVMPIYGRSADNIRDHRHVTSLLHRILLDKKSVTVRPVLSFDERGHQKNDTSYKVTAFGKQGELPAAIYPTVFSYIGEGGSFYNPKAVRENLEQMDYSEEDLAGKEALGAFKFREVSLKPGQTVSYFITYSASGDANIIEKADKKYTNPKAILDELTKIREYWPEKVNVDFHTEDSDKDNYLRWICFQPILRRIYGCSFLPYHDYGKGGRGWRDLWQDCLALLIMKPDVVRKMIVNNFGGVRVDGTNATIIGSGQGEFIADRNGITRVWMDHAFWPFLTTKFYIERTGDIEVLLDKATYFKDPQNSRGRGRDLNWRPLDGNKQRDCNGEIYYGSLMEHLLVQNLAAFFDVGDHNHLLLRGADWNDALDMASDKGESVAFTCAYAGNLVEMAGLLEKIKASCGYSRIEIMEELYSLISENTEIYDSVKEKRALLQNYLNKLKNTLSGKTIVVDISYVINNLKKKAQWMMDHIRKTEWLDAGDGMGWFNSYYDNHGNKVESVDPDHVRMMLTGQVFAIMSGTATDDQVKAIMKAADKYLYDKNAGGYRLNTNFHEEKFDLGRMFGFAYGEKENGAVFSHMAVMYGNALIKRGCKEAGMKALDSLLEQAMDFDKSFMYPGIPEYFDNSGRGLYPYLTGAASWYMMTIIK